MLNMQNIKSIRNENNLSQKDVANILKVSRSSYAMWESNNNIFPLKRLIDYCNYFNISLDFAFNLTPTKQYKNFQTNIDLKLIGNRLKEFRIENNLKQENIASILHIDQPTWSIYENGKSLIGTPFLYIICSKYSISADYLLGRIENPKYINNR